MEIIVFIKDENFMDSIGGGFVKYTSGIEIGIEEEGEVVAIGRPECQRTGCGSLPFPPLPPPCFSDGHNDGPLMILNEG